MRVEIKYDDLLSSKERIIVHQVNCQGVMGAGIAKQIKEKWPDVYTSYRDLLLQQDNDPLGLCQFVDIGNGQKVCNLFGQRYCSEDQAEYPNERQTSYDAFSKALNYLHTAMKKNNIESFAIPYGIGCGLAKGNWKIITALLDEEFDSDNDIKLVVYKKLK